ncbi:hypothetical protein [Mesorhizobium captivum]|uniref:hypothetical protein n=1 Tax=Mesorhizobium captivum TaxID=3072319 RepID=UPI003D322C7D
MVGEHDHDGIRHLLIRQPHGGTFHTSGLDGRPTGRFGCDRCRAPTSAHIPLRTSRTCRSSRSLSSEGLDLWRRTCG